MILIVEAVLLKFYAGFMHYNVSAKTDFHKKITMLVVNKSATSIALPPSFARMLVQTDAALVILLSL